MKMVPLGLISAFRIAFSETILNGIVDRASPFQRPLSLCSTVVPEF